MSGQPLAAGRHGLLVDVRGVVGHVPASEAHKPPPRAGLRARFGPSFEGWVCAVGDDLVHLTTSGPSPAGDDGEIRTGIVAAAGPSGAVVRLDADGTRAIVPWGELSWEPSLGDAPLKDGDRVTGRVVGLTLEGPVLSPRSVLPTPWPAIALALPPGRRVPARVERVIAGRAELRTCCAPRARAIIEERALPEGAAPGAPLEATVVRVDAIAGLLALGELISAAR